MEITHRLEALLRVNRSPLHHCGNSLCSMIGILDAVKYKCELYFSFYVYVCNKAARFVFLEGYGRKCRLVGGSGKDEGQAWRRVGEVKNNP